MLRRLLVPLVLGVVLGAAADARADTGPVLGPDGTTAPVYDLADAVTERVFIPQPGIDQDDDGQWDRVVADVLRPTSPDPAVRFPAIVEPSPYFTTVCRGIEGQCIGDTDGDGRNNRWPLFYDNFFVPRGYAYVLAHANGTGASTGCPLHGGPGDVAGIRSVIDWLNGRTAGYASATGTTRVDADWHNGRSALIGKSYDGTLANGVAVTGVAGLSTIVPISGISDWYRYSRSNGIAFNANYPGTLSETVTNAGRRAVCAPSRAVLDRDDGDETGDETPFWQARDYVKDAGKVRAAVFATHGLQDDNVKLDHLATWWAALGAAKVPRKLWLLREGHVDPFDARRAVWVDTLHRWFDFWLQNVPNRVMDEPAVDIETSADRWETAPSWPVPGAADVALHLQATTTRAAGTLDLQAGGTTTSVGFENDPGQSETTALADPSGSQASRRVFLSAPLRTDLRLSGTPRVRLRATLDAPQADVGALVADLGTGTQVARSPGDGIERTSTTSCWGSAPADPADYSACYPEVRKRVAPVSAWRVTRGILDSSNRSSLETPTPVTPGEPTDLAWPLVPTDAVIPKGHRLALIVVGDYPTLGTTQLSADPGVRIALDLPASTVTLPVVGGRAAVEASGAFTPVAPAPGGQNDGAPSAPGVPAPPPAVTGGEAAQASTGTTPPATLDRVPTLVRDAALLGGARPRLRLRLARSARVTVTVRRARGRTLVRETRRLRAGRRTIRLRTTRLRAGRRYRVTIVVREPGGARARVARTLVLRP